ncbi:MAG: hypothetical protein JNK15_06865 [Planctomycetes bacterium]|nr:hypothetical protein [Planctomycetota bacterium]
MVVYWILFAVRFAAIAVVARYLAAALGALPALAAIATLATALGALGTVLLRTSPLGVVTWKNRTAGWLLPFCMVLGANQLPAMLASSVAVITVAAATGIGNGGHWLLTAAWTLDAIAAAFAWRAFRAHSPGSSGRRSVTRVLIAAFGLAGAGLVLLQLDRPGLAIAVAGGPPATVGAFSLAWILLLVTLGRNARWN